MLSNIPEVTDAATAKSFFRALHASGLLFHPEESAADCLSHHGLSADDLDFIERNMGATFEHLPDPCEVALEIVR